MIAVEICQRHHQVDNGPHPLRREHDPQTLNRVSFSRLPGEPARHVDRRHRPVSSERGKQHGAIEASAHQGSHRLASRNPSRPAGIDLHVLTLLCLRAPPSSRSRAPPRDRASPESGLFCRGDRPYRLGELDAFHHRLISDCRGFSHASHHRTTIGQPATIIRVLLPGVSANPDATGSHARDLGGGRCGRHAAPGRASLHPSCGLWPTPATSIRNASASRPSLALDVAA